MKFYNDTKLLYLETDASGIGLGAALLQLCDNTACQKGMALNNTILCPIAFASKSLTGAEWRYSNIEHEVLGTLHGLEKFHHYCFGREVLVITDHKPLIAMFKKDIATLLQHIQCILLKIHPYRVQIIYKPGPNIFTADWLLKHNHIEGKDKPIKGMDIRVDTIQSKTDMPECMSMAEIQQASSQDNHLQQLKSFIISFIMKIPLRPWEVIGADVFHFNNKNYLCIVDYNSKFPVVKRLEGLSADSLIDTVKIIFTKYGIPQKIMSDADTNFMSDMFWQFCKTINIEQSVSSAYHHQSNAQVKACIKFIKCTFKKCADLGRDINMALLQICTMLLGPGLPSPAILMFNRQV